MPFSGGGQTSVDQGYFTGSFTYGPTLATASSILTIPFGTGPDQNGISWIWTGIDGFDSPDVAGQVSQQAADHGGWPVSQYYAPRTMTMRIEANCPNQSVRDIARGLLNQVIPVNDLCTWQYNEPVPKLMQLRRSGRITETLPNLTDAQFSAVVTAPDPRKYNAVQKVLPTAVMVFRQFFTTGRQATGNNLSTNPNFAGGSSASWTGFNGTIAINSSPPAGGGNTPFALTLTPGGTAQPAAEENGTNGPFAVQQNTTISITAWVYCASNASSALIGFDFTTASGTYVSTTATTVPITTANTWQQVASGNITVPVGTNVAQAYGRVGFSGTALATDTMQIEAVVINGPSFSDIGQNSSSRFMQLPPGTTPASVRATNAGTFETRPVITVIGPASRVILRNDATGQSVSYSQVVLNGGDVLIVDFYQRFATKNGIYVPADVQSSWWSIWPGTQVIRFVGGDLDAGAAMVVTYRDAWI